MSSRKQQRGATRKKRSKVGRPKGDDPRDHRISVALTASEWAELEDAAASEHRTVAALARLLILEAMESRR